MCTFPIWQEWAGKVRGELGVRAVSESFLTAAAGKRNWLLREALPCNQPAEVTFVLNRPSISSTQVTMAEIFPRFPDLQASCLSKLLPGTQE